MSVLLPANLISSGEGLPTICSRHGRESTTAAKCRFISRPPRWAPFLLLAGFLPYLIVVMVLRKTVNAPYWPMCDECSQRKRTRLIGGWSAVVGSILLFVLAFTLLGSTTTTTNAYGYQTREPGSGAGLGAFLVLIAFVVFVAGLVFAGQGSAMAVAGGFTTQDGMNVEFRKPAPKFVQWVTETLNASHAGGSHYAQHGYAQHGYAQQGYAQAPQGYAQPSYGNPSYPQPNTQPDPGNPPPSR